MATMLRSESSEAEWQLFYENELSKTSIVKDNMLPLLKLCYDHLPSPLKHCFAYCSLFPKNHEYDVQTMIKLWMAQGLIMEEPRQSPEEPGQPGQSPEDVGYEYVLSLLERCFFQDAKIDVRKHVMIKFRMHEQLHDLAVSVAGDWCRMLSSGTQNGINYARTSQVSVDFGSLSAKDMENFEKIQSILLLKRISEKQVFDILSNRLIFLRVLDMHAQGIKAVPHSIGKLNLLRYLDLSENEDIKKLPNSITKLLYLQTLRLSSCSGLKKLPRDFQNLVNLRHLEIEGCYNLTSLPSGILGLSNLQTLSQLVVSKDTSPNIGLNTLRNEVHIKNLGHEEFDLNKYLDVLPDVRSLSLKWESNAPESAEHRTPLRSDLLEDLEELTLHGFRGMTLFDSICPSKLVKLSLRGCINCKVLPTLEDLLHLKVLILDEFTELEYISESALSTPTFFPSLHELGLTELPKLQGWWKDGVTELLPSFPRLSKLVIEDCPKLASMPLFPTVEKGLVLDTSCWKAFQDTMNQMTIVQEESPSSSTPSPSPSPPLSKLKALCIVGVKEHEADKVRWESLKSLRFLRFDNLPNLEPLLDGLQQVTSLQELHLCRCGIKEIPEWISQLTDLEKLVIRICPLLKSLPDSISSLQFLKTLEISKCNTLLRRCEKEIGADWEKIKSIKNRPSDRIYQA